MIGTAMLAMAAASVTLADLQGLDGAERAKALLTPGVAAKVVGGTITRTDMFGRGWVAKFWEKPRVLGATTCQRTVHAVRIGTADKDLARTSAMTVTRLDSYEQVATTLKAAASDASCAVNPAYVAVKAGDVPAAQQLLSRLSQAVRAAQGDAPLPFAISCDDVSKTAVCADPRDALAGLPLGKMLAIDPTGALFTISGDTPTVLIDKTQSDPSSWIVRLAGQGGTPTRVDLVHAEMTFGGS